MTAITAIVSAATSCAVSHDPHVRLSDGRQLPLLAPSGPLSQREKVLGAMNEIALHSRLFFGSAPDAFVRALVPDQTRTPNPG
jgi:hypothetical protein